MTTRDFIAKTYNTGGDVRRCSSVMTDTEGVVYSYGRHYPLAIHIAGLDFVNTRGYSTTTAKHIGWAHSALGYSAIDIEIEADHADTIANASNTDDVRLDAVLSTLKRKRHDLSEAMNKKKRQDTQVYKQLEQEFDQVSSSIERVRQAL